jgi:hypothetical protein
MESYPNSLRTHRRIGLFLDRAVGRAVKTGARLELGVKTTNRFGFLGELVFTQERPRIG